ncbi:LCP family protein [Allofustis seminis]|uniref:LCP family glycopolymer transferase n=1 Tax=Allofustis seminis TaxID=166939 RepID=UPI000367D321|nr:LCP family protein [Allofustis seminis]
MEETPITRMERYHLEKNKKTKKRGGCLKWFLIILICIIGMGACGYFQFKGSIDKIHEDVSEEVDPHESRGKKVNLKRGDAFSVLLLGIDTGEYGRVDQGRSDSIMIMTISPKNNRTRLTSIPRDSLVPIVGHDTTDKINHAYAYGGAAMSINTIQSFLDVPIDYYVAINMAGVQQMVDAVGGITITPQTTFTQGNFTFYEGQITHMDGAMALEYSRMRELDGDYARQNRQREVVMAIIAQLVTVEGVMNYQSVLKAMEQNIQTNMTFDEMVEVSLNYRDAAGTIENDQLSGEGTTIDGIYYEIISDEEVARVSAAINKELFGE